MLDVAFTLRASGRADPDVVWGRYTDLGAWPRWSPQITSVTAPTQRLAPGLAGTVHGPFGVAVPFEVDDVDELGRSWSWHVRFGPVGVRMHHAVLSGGRGGSTTTLRQRGPAPVVMAYAPVAQLALVRLVQP